MTIFDFLNDILFTKKGKSFTNIDSESSFIPFMLNRWISMYSDEYALKCNVINKYLAFSPEKKNVFTLFMSYFPKTRFKRITYHKRTKEKKEEIDETIALTAHSQEMSEREVLLYRETLNFLNP